MLLALPKLFRNNTNWLEKQQNSILSAATIITIFNIISAISGFFRNWLFIKFFYDTSISSKEALNALIVAFQVPDLLFQLVVYGAMSAAFIPVFISYKKDDEKMAFELTSILMTLLLLLFVIFSAAVFFLAEPITYLRTGYNPLTDADQIQIVVNLTRIMLVGQFFLAISSFFGSILNSYQRFIIPALAPVLYNLGVLAGVLLFSSQFGIYSAGLGVAIGGFIHMIVQLPLVYKLGFRYKPSFNINFPGIKHIFKLTPPRLLAVSVGEIRQLLLGFFATSIGGLTMVIMQLALTIMTAPIRFFGTPISQAALPFLSEEVAKNDTQKFQDLIVQSLHQISFFILPASMLVLILRVPIVRLLYGASNNLPWDTTILTGKVIGIIAVSIAAQGLVQLLVRAFYALKDTRTPLLVALFDILFYFILSGITIYWWQWGVLGLAIATSVSAILELLLILYFLDRRIHCFSQKSFLLPQFKMISSSFLMAVFLYLPFRILDQLVFDTSRTIELIGLTITTGTIGMLVYIYFSALFEVKELTFFTNLISSFGPWRKSLEKTTEVLVEASSVEGDHLG